VCGKPDWCLRRPDGSAAICARTPSDKPVGTEGAGWLHYFDRGHSDIPRSSRSIWLADLQARADFTAYAAECARALPSDGLEHLATSLGLTAAALERLAVGWDREYRCYTFPMRDERERIVGVRLRNPSGGKFAVTGSQSGLFIPSDLGQVSQLFIAEGPTDCAALLDLGVSAVGRPSCSGGIPMLARLVQRLRPTAVTIVADADTPGQRGAATLARALVLQAAQVRIITPPADSKDIRGWKTHGATHADLMRAMHAAEPCSTRFMISMEARNG
jgi:hypothetical protein